MKRRKRVIQVFSVPVFWIGWSKLIVAINLFIFSGSLFHYAVRPPPIITGPFMALFDASYRTLAEAMAVHEGYGKPGTLATVNNNPGNIIAGTWATQQGAIGSNRGFAIFPNSDAGFAAQEALIEHYADAGYSLDQLVTAWAPPTAPGNSQASTTAYQQAVSKAMNVPGSTKVSQLAGLEPNSSSMSITDAIKNFFTPEWASDSSWGRIGAFLLGLILIGGGLYLFKPVQETVTRAAATTSKAAMV
jgi:hypothetical protein